jgi:TolA-binding protein
MRYQNAIVLFIIVLLGTSADGCSSTPPTDDELLKSATAHHGNDEFDAALTDFRKLTQLHPTSDKVPEALYAMGVIYQDTKKEYKTAESLYTKLVWNFPADPTAMSAAYQRARILAWNLHQPDSAIAAYEFFLRRYPDAMTVSSARQELDSLKTTLSRTR